MILDAWESFYMFLFHSHWKKGQSTSGIKGLSLPQTWWQKQTAAEFFNYKWIPESELQLVPKYLHKLRPNVKTED